MNTAVISGPDYIVGPDCHSAYFIRIDDPSANESFDTLPRFSGIDLNVATPANPINVKLNWHNAPGCNTVIIDEIVQIK